MPFLLFCLFPVCVFLCLWSMYFFAHQLLDSFFIFLYCLSYWLLHHQFSFFSLFPLPLLLIFFSLFSYASIINLCGSFIFSRFVELF
ncbi:hypothetical protein NC653_004048 [Populus alba x Populus x berolinensis]|uniref:Uncharacterized protein n=1 Tax=Populus alba x Populus x berolinensis TaxID=444605 RepID=A0AAD6WJ26_9ROSI|nr:hypothetical protein NC653_004048 [Populus alba x Populus x berolinensis]